MSAPARERGGRSERAAAAGPGGVARVAVLVSGSGSNLEALLECLNRAPGAPARVAHVVASRAGIPALARAERAGVSATVLSDDAAWSGGRALLDALREAEAHLVVLAGFLRLVPPVAVRAFRGRMVNVHPALLPSFGGPGMYGRRVHEAVLHSGARVTGATVHFVDEAYDRGPIIAQWPVPVLEGDDPPRLAARVLEAEHRLLPEVVVALARGEVRLDGARCRWLRPWFQGSRFRLVAAEAEPTG